MSWPPGPGDHFLFLDDNRRDCRFLKHKLTIFSHADEHGTEVDA